MNRKIKFRGKRIKGNTWVYGAYVPAMDEDSLDSIIDADGVWCLVRSATVGQFTGLRDKNGKEIYEGDIIHFKTKREYGYPEDGNDIYQEIVYCRHNERMDVIDAHIGFVARSRRGNTASIEYHARSHDAVVITTIHDNPELLKTEQR